MANMWNTTIELNVFYFDLWHENIKADLEGFERGLLEVHCVFFFFFGLVGGKHLFYFLAPHLIKYG